MILQNAWSIVRWLLLGIIFAIVFLLGIVFFPIIYPIELKYGWKKHSFGWWFVNRDEGDKISNLYGDLGWRNSNGIVIEDCNWFQRSYIAFRWMTLRNPHWNLKLTVKPKSGWMEKLQVIINEGSAAPTTFRNHTLFGMQFAFFTVEGSRYFRFSISKPVTIFGIKKQWIVQLGSSGVRYIYKNKLSDIL
jgi:hypothetical protein